MPTTFTHDWFGKKVYQKMPQEMRRLVKAHGELYRIGQHGPDVLFYYGFGKNRVNRHGVRLHGEAAAPFFERGAYLVKEQQDDALLVSHGEIEKELDRRLMVLTGRNPHRYYPAACCIRPSRENACVIQKVFPEVTVRQVESALRNMIFITNTMVYDDNGRKQKVILSLLKLTGHYDEVGGNYMKAVCDPRCAPYLEELEKLLEQAVKETPKMLEALWNAARKGERLPERFWRNYK